MIKIEEIKVGINQNNNQFFLLEQMVIKLSPIPMVNEKKELRVGGTLISNHHPTNKFSRKNESGSILTFVTFTSHLFNNYFLQSIFSCMNFLKFNSMQPSSGALLKPVRLVASNQRLRLIVRLPKNGNKDKGWWWRKRNGLVPWKKQRKKSWTGEKRKTTKKKKIQVGWVRLDWPRILGEMTEPKP